MNTPLRKPKYYDEIKYLILMRTFESKWWSDHANKSKNLIDIAKIKRKSNIVVNLNKQTKSQYIDKLKC